jgi:molybdopterin/thiamine biosynthesis adenylyltransferase
MERSSLSSRVIDRSPDLARLRADDYEIQIHPSNHLLVRSVPYVTSERNVAYGMLVVPIAELNDGVVGRPQNHQAYFAGDYPCDNDGKPLSVLGQANRGKFEFAGGLEAQYHLSYKSPKFDPTLNSYRDYYDLVTSYVDETWKYAKRLDAAATPLTGRVLDLGDEPSVFVYPDTASTRAGITAVSEKLAGHIIAIIGVGGTGSYVLDLVSKTPVKEIRLYDGDWLSQHNAFRSPGAASVDDIFANPRKRKVEYFFEKYSAIHRGIVPYPINLDGLPEGFGEVDFTFLCIDAPTAKRHIVDELVRLGKPFIDVGMGVSLAERILIGSMHTILSNEACRTPRHAISFADVDDEYATNIQIADLNAMNATLAVIRWKKCLGFYRAQEEGQSCIYTVDFNRIDNGPCR